MARSGPSPARLAHGRLRSISALALVLAVVGCGRDVRTSGASHPASPSRAAVSGVYNAEQLVQALLTDVGGYDRSEAPQAGRYAELAAVQNADQMRQEVVLDRPECAAATRPKAWVDSVRTAPAAMVAFARGRQTVSETLMAVGPDAAARQVDLKIPGGCRMFRARIGGRWSTGRVIGTAGERIGEDSRTVGVATTTGGTTVRTWFVVLRSRGYLATITVYGPGAARDEAERVARQAYRRAERTLP